jgi:hypothetical protein
MQSLWSDVGKWNIWGWFIPVGGLVMALAAQRAMIKFRAKISMEMDNVIVNRKTLFPNAVFIAWNQPADVVISDVNDWGWLSNQQQKGLITKENAFKHTTGTLLQLENLLLGNPSLLKRGAGRNGHSFRSP